MSIRDDVMEDSIETNQSEDIISPEIAWADSCLIKDLESDSTFTDALLKTLDSLTDSSNLENQEIQIEELTDPVTIENHDSLEAKIRKMNIRRKGKEIDEGEVFDIHALISEQGEEEEKSDEDHNNATFVSTYNMENVFRPTYNESLKDVKNYDSDLDFEFTVFDIDQTPKDIFKVWDLEIPREEEEEEDELLIQLKKALNESGVMTSSSPSDDATLLTDVKGVDDLISGLADLSLIHNSL